MGLAGVVALNPSNTSTSLRLGPECLGTTLVIRFLGDVVDEVVVDAVVAAVAAAVLAAQRATVFFFFTNFFYGRQQ